MARTKGAADKNPRKPRSDKKTPAAGEVGHNSEGAPPTTGDSTLTDDEQRAIFVNGLAELEVMNKEKDSIVGKIRNKRQQLEARGFNKDDVDFGLDLRKGDDKAIVKRRRREQQIARWLNHPIAQLDLFSADQENPQPIGDKAFEEGKIVGMEGRKCEPPANYAGETQQQWISGWHEGQAVLIRTSIRAPSDGTLIQPTAPAPKQGGLDDEILDDQPQAFDAKTEKEGAEQT